MPLCSNYNIWETLVSVMSCKFKHTVQVLNECIVRRRERTIKLTLFASGVAV